jgi:GT2 family glycosyltransferase
MTVNAVSSSGRDLSAVAVVVVSFNSAKDIEGCVRSLSSAIGVGAVAVVDNASVDGSPELVRAVADDRVRLIALDENTGFAGGCNRGWAELRGGAEIIAFMNPDVRIEPDCLARCAEILAERPDVAGVAPRLMRSDGDTVDSVGQLLNPRTLEVLDRGYGRPLDEELLESTELLAACGALAVFRREALDQVADDHGPWAEHFFCFWEDFELGWRLVNRGWKILSAPDAVAEHGRGAGARDGRGPLRWRRPPELEACVVSNRWMTLVRHLHSRDLIRRLPVLIAWDLAAVTLGSLRRPSLLVHLGRRWPLVYREWRLREQFPRKRLGQLPC